MKLPYEINLIEGAVLPRQRRALCFWLMVSYFVFCGLLVVLVANKVTRDLVHAGEIRRDVELMEIEVRETYPGHSDPVACLRMMSDQLEQDAARLASLNRVIGGRANLAPVLAAILRPLPRAAYLLNVKLDGEKKTLSFDVVVPAGMGARAPDAGELLARWAEDAPLRGEVSGLASTISQRQRIGGEESFVLSFTCDLAKGKT